MRRFLFIFLVVSSCISADEEPEAELFSEFMVEISDEELRMTIDSFIKKNNIDSKRSYVTLNIYSIGQREIFYLSYETDLYFDITGYPTYLSTYDDHLIFIYSSISDYISTDIYEAIKKYSELYGITYSHNEDELYHPDIWKLTRCEGNKLSVNRRATSLIEDYIPCGYQFNSRLNRLDTMVVRY